MTSPPPAISRFARELRRRRVYTTAGLYVVGAWLVMQAADVFFPGWGIHDAGINVLLAAAVIGFPLALVFGWFFNITARGIRRTLPADPDGAGEPRPLRGNDYLILGALVTIAAGILIGATHKILDMPRIEADGFETRMGPAPDEKPENSLAVLPFVNVSNDPENEFFCDGVSEEILNKLAAHAELHVIGRTSSFVFKRSGYGIPRISALLGVRYLLQGSVRKVGDRLRISAQLVDESGAQRWSDSFDRTLDDIFAIQTEIADLVATTVAPQIVRESSVTYVPNVAAYDHLLAGRELFYRREADRAREEFRKAIDLDAGYAEPYAEWAVARLIGTVDESELAEAREAIETALTLRPGMPRALAARGLLLESQSPPDYEGAEAVFRRVLEQDPKNLDAMNWLAIVLRTQGKMSESNALLHNAYRRDPLHTASASNVVRDYLQRGDLVRAERVLLRLVEMPDPPQSPFMFLGWSYAMLAMWDSAEYCIQRSLRDWPDKDFNPWLAGLVNAWKGQYEAALEDFNLWIGSRGLDARDLSTSDSGSYAYYLAMAGHYQEAIEVMQPEYERAPAVFGDLQLDASHALALALIGVGEDNRARTLLESIEEASASQRIFDQKRNPLAYWLARNAVLLGDKELALSRLELAIDTGWRGYYTDHHDPRWSSVADDPRFQAMMAEVKADVDRQRAEVEQIEAEDNFPGLLDQLREREKGEADGNTGEP